MFAPPLSCCFWMWSHVIISAVILSATILIKQMYIWNQCSWYFPKTHLISFYIKVFSFFFFFFWVFLSFRAAPVAYGGSQVRGGIRATAAGLHHSHSNFRFEPHPWPMPQLTAMQILNPLSRARDRTCVLMDTNRVCNPLSHKTLWVLILKRRITVSPRDYCED